MIVVAPSQSGKTTGLAIPALLEWQGPVLATSVKTDLLRRQPRAARGARRGDGLRSRPGHRAWRATWATPLHGCGSWHGAMRVAHWLAGRRGPGSGGLEDSEFWYAAAEKLLAPLLFAAASSGQDDGRRRRAGSTRAGGERRPRWRDARSAAGCAEAERAWQATQNREARQRSSIYTTAETHPRRLRRPAGDRGDRGAPTTPRRGCSTGARTPSTSAPPPTSRSGCGRCSR